MTEEHGYERSGKKCREKFENLYKYYKKTKVGKAGRQDGKHYRFFRQLEAIYGETTNKSSILETHLATNTLPFHYHTTNNYMINQGYQEDLQDQKFCESLSFSNSSEFDTSSSENNDDDLSAIAFMMNQSMEKKQRVLNESQSCRRVRKSWKAKVNDYIELQMRKLEETQEAWMEKMLKTIEHREQERMSREEEWRKQEVARFDREHEFWGKERAWIEARDVALIEALKKFTGKGIELLSLSEQITGKSQNQNKNPEKNANELPDDTVTNSNKWTKPEISILVQLRTSLEPKFQETGYAKGSLWEEVVAKMACLGHERTAVECKEKWENISIYFQHLNSYHGHEDIGTEDLESMGLQRSDDSASASNFNVGTLVHDGCCFYNLMDGGDQLWEKNGLKLSKGKPQHT